MNSNSPIGFFDSGVGGTSIWKEVVTLLPYESTIYLADSKNAPYGEKATDEILALSIKNTAEAEQILTEMRTKKGGGQGLICNLMACTCFWNFGSSAIFFSGNGHPPTDCGMD